ncbi:hypothetical protein D3C81_1806490 [compost metagenome]
MDGPLAQAQFLPGGDSASKDSRQLRDAQLGQGIVGVNDHGNAVQANDLFGGSAIEVAQRLQFVQLTTLDRP